MTAGFQTDPLPGGQGPVLFADLMAFSHTTAGERFRASRGEKNNRASRGWPWQIGGVIFPVPTGL